MAKEVDMDKIKLIADNLALSFKSTSEIIDTCFEDAPSVNKPADFVLDNDDMKRWQYCPTCPIKDYLANLIVHINDEHKWTREQIADWLDTLENQPVFYPDVRTDDEKIAEAEQAKKKKNFTEKGPIQYKEDDKFFSDGKVVPSKWYNEAAVKYLQGHISNEAIPIPGAICQKPGCWEDTSKNSFYCKDHTITTINSAKAQTSQKGLSGVKQGTCSVTMPDGTTITGSVTSIKWSSHYLEPTECQVTFYPG